MVWNTHDIYLKTLTLHTKYSFRMQCNEKQRLKNLNLSLFNDGCSRDPLKILWSNILAKIIGASLFTPFLYWLLERFFNAVRPILCFFQVFCYSKFHFSWS